MSAKAKQKATNKKVQAIRLEEQKDQEFLSAYKTLCKRHRRELNAVPGWRFSPDGNDYRLALQIQVARWKEDVVVE